MITKPRFICARIRRNPALWRVRSAAGLRPTVGYVEWTPAEQAYRVWGHPGTYATPAAALRQLAEHRADETVMTREGKGN